MQIVQSLTVTFAILAAWAWMKSAWLSLNRPHGKDWLDRAMNRISTNANVWNAIAAGLAALSAIMQAVGYSSAAA